MKDEPRPSPPHWLRATFWGFVGLEWAAVALALALFLGLVAGIGAVLGAQVVLADQTQYAPGFRNEAFQEIRTGMTEEEVLQLLGTPLKVHEASTVNGRPRWYSSVWAEGPAAVANVDRRSWEYSLPGRMTDVYWVYKVDFGADRRVAETFGYLHSD